MCGIFCVLGEKSENLNINEILKIQKHRGPDFSDYIKKDNLVLASNRLKIIDVNDNANMPLKHGSITIIFNGFISNYKYLKKDLVKLGVNFKTDGDTEVLAAMLNTYPYALSISKLEGMWSFIAYDSKNEKLIISRDDFGIKPLFYYFDKKNLIFASEVNTLLSIVKPKLNLKDNIQNYFFTDSCNKDFCGNETTFFKDIKYYPPNTYSLIDLKTQFSNFSFEKIKRAKNKDKLNNEDFLSILNKKFDDYKFADVKKGIPLSGGIDSNVINYYYQNEKDMSAFSIIDIDQYSKNNENELIQKVVKKNKIPHEFIDTKKIISFEFFSKIIKKFKCPINSPTLINSAALRFKANQENIKVIYSGTGGDELFGGYPQQFIFYLKYLREKKDYLKAIKLFFNGSIICASGKNTNKKIINYLTGFKNSLNLLKSNDYFQNKSNFENKKFFNDNFSFSNETNLNFLNPVEYNYHLIKNIRMPYWLSSEDFISSLYSIENRVPFLNQELVELSQNVYDQNCYSWGYSKYKIRKIFKNKINRYVLNNKIKLNQPGSFDNFMFGEFFDMNRETLKNSSFFNKNIIQELEENKKTYDDFMSGIIKKYKINTSFLFKAVCFEIFLKSTETS